MPQDRIVNTVVMALERKATPLAFAGSCGKEGVILAWRFANGGSVLAEARSQG
jgi:hypothetical protein